MRLYTYFRSSAAYRVRIALNLKGLAYDAMPVHLVRGGGEQHGADYRALNPAGLVPALEDGGAVLTQSLAIVEYLDETHPEPPLLPGDALARARIRALAQAIACDIHPINNLRVLQYLKRELGASDEQKNAWYRHWVETGLAAVEATLAAQPQAGRFCVGDSPTLADVCLVPQVYNARRFACRIDGLARTARVVEACEALAAFRLAAPENQPDAE
ncbi:MAG TPA: maleylacetoacetate isomerase [Rhodocyclaceae bacterium]|nr:maleylacetoacetate isomerase [Rhodocyclaceae bacterium]